MKELGLARFLRGAAMRKALIRKGAACVAGVGAVRVGAGQGLNATDSQPPPGKSSVRFRTAPHLVAARKMGGGPGEGRKKKSKPPHGVPHGAGVLMVLRELLAARYPRSAAAIAASAGVSRATAYRALMRLEVDSGLPVVRERVQDPMGGAPLALWGIDWPRLRGMG